jgi:hypothetical protein
MNTTCVYGGIAFAERAYQTQANALVLRIRSRANKKKSPVLAV